MAKLPSNNVIFYQQLKKITFDQIFCLNRKKLQFKKMTG